MPVSKKKVLNCIVKMLEESRYPFSIIYVGNPPDEALGADLGRKVESAAAEGKLLEAQRADFGALFRQMDFFIVHGGLGTTVEALRMKKPVCITGLLLMDQRFWGKVCYEQNVGPHPVHIDRFHDSCVDFINRALDPASDWVENAAKSDWGHEDNDGVKANVDKFATLLENIMPICVDEKERTIIRERRESLMRGQIQGLEDEISNGLAKQENMRAKIEQLEQEAAEMRAQLAEQGTPQIKTSCSNASELEPIESSEQQKLSPVLENKRTVLPPISDDP